MIRVVITGIGCVTPIGTGVEGLWAGLKAKRSAVGTLTRFDPEPFKSKVAAEVCDFRPQDHLTRKGVRRLDRFSQFGLVAAIHAVEDSALVLERENRDRIGVMMGSALGGVAHAEAQAARFMAQGLRYVDPSIATSVFGGAVSCNIAIHLGATGPNSTNAMSCASGAIALGDGFDIKGFHDTVIGSGMLPLETLGSIVRAWAGV